jgi:hypothetical protein
MADYRLYHIANGHFSRVEIFSANNDREAIDRVIGRPDCPTAERWCGARRVDSFEPAMRNVG